jgi:hypothetical protein
MVSVASGVGYDDLVFTTGAVAGLRMLQSDWICRRSVVVTLLLLGKKSKYTANVTV